MSGNLGKLVRLPFIEHNWIIRISLLSGNLGKLVRLPFIEQNWFLT